MQTILVLKGVPGSGKSTYAKAWLEESPETRVIVNRDTIRVELSCFPIGNNTQEKRVSEKEIEYITTAIKEGKDVCIDATNLNPKTLEKWAKLASDLSVNIEYKEFVVSLDEALKRDKIREKPVGKRVLFSFFERYYPEESKIFFTDKRLRIKKAKNRPYKKAIICDLDGTLAIHTGRSPYAYNELSTDIVNQDLKNLLLTLSHNYDILFVSGREDSCKEATKEWLIKNFADLWKVEWKLYMRKAGDFRKDAIVKEEIYKTYIEPEYDRITVFDDRNQCVDMWRELGLLCCQVWYGDF